MTKPSRLAVSFTPVEPYHVAGCSPQVIFGYLTTPIGNAFQGDNYLLLHVIPVMVWDWVYKAVGYLHKGSQSVKLLSAVIQP